MLIYALDCFWVKRDTTFFEPGESVVKTVIASFYSDDISKFVENMFYGKTDIYGITREFAKLFIMREWLKLYHVGGFSGATALVGAKANFVNFMSKRAAAVGWVAIGIAAAAVVLGIVFAIMDWTEKEDGRIDFPVGACILRYGNRLWWGGVVGRAYTYWWDFFKCSEIGDKLFYEHRITGSGYLGLDEWDFLGAWEAKEKKLVGWYVYRFGVLRLRYLGLGHNLGFGRYRLGITEFAEQPYDYPVGWGIREHDVCEYLGNFSDYFV